MSMFYDVNSKQIGDTNIESDLIVIGVSPRKLTIQ